MDSKTNNTATYYCTNGAYSYFNQWKEPVLVKSKEVGDTIEFIYKQTSLISHTSCPSTSP